MFFKAKNRRKVLRTAVNQTTRHRDHWGAHASKPIRSPITYDRKTYYDIHCVNSKYHVAPKLFCAEIIFQIIEDLFVYVLRLTNLYYYILNMTYIFLL